MKNLLIVSNNRENFNGLLMNLIDAGYDFQVENGYSTTERAVRLQSEDVLFIQEIAQLKYCQFFIL